MNRTTLAATIAALLTFNACGGSDDAEPADSVVPGEEDVSATPEDTVAASGGEETAPQTNAPIETEVPTTSTTMAPATTTTSTTTTSTTTTLPPDPMAVAAERYVELVTPLNCSGELVSLAYTEFIGNDGFQEWEWPTVRDGMHPSWEAYRGAHQTFLDGLVDSEWPSEVQGVIDDLIGEIALDVRYWGSLASAETLDQYLAADATFNQDRGAATVARAILDLPSNVANDVEFCQAILAGEVAESAEAD